MALLLASLAPLSDAAADDSPGLITATNACMLWFKGAFPDGTGFFHIQDVSPTQSVRYVYVGSGGSTGAPTIPGPAILWLPDGTMLHVDWLLNVSPYPCRIILDPTPVPPPPGASPFPKGL